MRYCVVSIFLVQLRFLSCCQCNRTVNTVQLISLLLKQSVLHRSRHQANDKPVYHQRLQQALVKLALH